jgi:hypothetical protein
VAFLRRRIVGAVVGLAAAALALGVVTVSAADRTLALAPGERVVLQGYGWQCAALERADAQCIGPYGEPVVFIRALGEYGLMVGSWQTVAKKLVGSATLKYVYRFGPGTRKKDVTGLATPRLVLRPGSVLRFPGLPAWQCQSIAQPQIVRCQGGRDWVVTVAKGGALTVQSRKSPTRERIQGGSGFAYLWR